MHVYMHKLKKERKKKQPFNLPIVSEKILSVYVGDVFQILSNYQMNLFFSRKLLLT